MIEKKNFIEAVTERDIDLLLLEELTVSSEFCKWFISQVCNDKLKELKGVWHSIADKRFGESDLVIIFITEDGIKYGLLIENKIGAVSQKEQYSRYDIRGAIGIENNLWDKYSICIVAPDLYLKTNNEAGKYKKNISYEKICNWFAANKSSKRYEFRAKMIKEAIEQNRRGYVITPDERVSAFWNEYFSFVIKHHKKLEMTEPGIKPANSDWPAFRPKILKKKMNIVHKLSRGAVDLQIFGMGDKLDEFYSSVSHLLKEEIELVKTGKSATLRITAPVVDRFLAFQDQINDVEQGLIAAEKLLNIGVLILDQKVK